MLAQRVESRIRELTTSYPTGAYDARFLIGAWIDHVDMPHFPSLPAI